MAKKPNLNTIGLLLSDIQEQFDSLKSVDENPDPLQVELFEATVNFMAANVSVFQKSIRADAVSIEGHPKPVVAPVIMDPEPVATPVMVQEKEVRTPIVSDEDTIESIAVKAANAQEEEPSSAFLFNVPAIEDIQKVEETQGTNEASAPASVTPAPKAPEPIIPASIEPIVPEPAKPEWVQPSTPDRPLSINEMMANQRKENPESNAGFNRMDMRKLGDLKSAISLNDKLLFIKDLFNGYSLAYSEAVELLNRYDTLAEADAFLQTNYAIKNQWSSKQETVNKLYAILNKRYGS